MTRLDETGETTLSVDAAYLQRAARRGVALATLDRRLAQAARRLGSGNAAFVGGAAPKGRLIDVRRSVAKDAGGQRTDARSRSSCSKALAIRSISAGGAPTECATPRQASTALATSFTMSRAARRGSPK